jgi:hypothetical protein
MFLSHDIGYSSQDFLDFVGAPEKSVQSDWSLCQQDRF